MERGQVAIHFSYLRLIAGTNLFVQRPHALSEGALVKRINRKLARDKRRLFTMRTDNDYLGRHYMVEMANMAIEWTHVDLESAARRFRVNAAKP